MKWYKERILHIAILAILMCVFKEYWIAYVFGGLTILTVLISLVNSVKWTYTTLNEESIKQKSSTTSTL